MVDQKEGNKNDAVWITWKIGGKRERTRTDVDRKASRCSLAIRELFRSTHAYAPVTKTRDCGRGKCAR